MMVTPGSKIANTLQIYLVTYHNLIIYYCNQKVFFKNISLFKGEITAQMFANFNRIKFENTRIRVKISAQTVNHVTSNEPAKYLSKNSEILRNMFLFAFCEKV